ncbi:hypothetical protein [Cognatishimia sp.]|uniref:hypothetical protein n=1 Tax=Cognatishimia sp. TaxID=2211648 RepID=UPI003516AE29|nr:hypothetical protein [Cognatishimia sp.]
MRHQSFEKFYCTKVGLGEGCGCAERVIDNHEIERIRAGISLGKSAGPGPLRRMISRLLGRKAPTPSAKD